MNDLPAMEAMKYLTRANNISIGLKAFKEFSLEEFAKLLGDVDLDGLIGGK